MEPTLTWNLVSDLRELLHYQFMVNAFQAGTVVAVLAAVIGWYMVLRRQTFAGHTIAVMSFPGAAFAALVAVPAALGYYLACAIAALAIAAGGGRGGGGDGGGRGPRHSARGARRVSASDGRGGARSGVRGARQIRGDAGGGGGGESAAIGVVQVAGLALGYLFLSLYGGVLEHLETLLFGTFLGIDRAQVLTLLLVALCVLGALALVGRQLLLATLDPQVARARGVPVRALDTGFLLLLSLAVAATAQITGALLVFALLVAPAAAAQTLTASPARGLALSVAFALLVTWLGLAFAYFSIYPLGFFVTSFGFASYLLAKLARGLTARRLTRRRPPLRREHAANPNPSTATVS